MIVFSILTLLALLVLGRETDMLRALRFWRRPKWMLVDEKPLIDAAGMAFEAELQQASIQGQLRTEGEAVQRVERLFQRLRPHALALRPEAGHWPWRIAVVDDGLVNAAVRPGGHIVVHSGLWQHAQLDDDQLAIVIGHEMAHALCEHQRESLSQQQILRQLEAAVPWAAWVGDEARRVVRDALHRLPLSRAAELEADALGIELAHRAGFRARAALTLWPALHPSGDGAADAAPYLSTHPATELRIAHAQKVLHALA